MIGKSGKRTIQEIISRAFDNLKGTLIGPSALSHYYAFGLRNYDPKKSLTQAYLHANTAQSLQDATDKQTVERLQDTANNYIDALKQKSVADIMRIVEENLATAKNKSKIGNQTFSEYLRSDDGRALLGKIRTELEAQKESINKGVELITNVELHNAQNHGAADSILNMSKTLGINDPTVCKIGVMDNKICKDCKKLWLMPDMMTPRVYKMSELSSDSGHWKDRKASISTTHPNCRHILTMVSPGFGFKSGKFSYVGVDHDEYSHQRKLAIEKPEES